MKMKEMVKNLIAKVKENKVKSGIITGLLAITLVGGTATAMLMSDNTAKADNNKTTVAKTVKKDDVKKSNSKKIEKEIKENKESKPEEVKEAEKKLEEAKKSGNVEAIKEAEKLVETKKSAVKVTASSNSTSKQSTSTSKQTASTSKQTASTSKQSVSNSSSNSSKSSTEASKPAAPQKKKVWVVTKPAWDEQVPDYNLPIYKRVEVARFYNGAGQLIYTIVDNSEDVNAKAEELAGSVKGLSLEEGYEKVPTGEYQTKTIHHEAEGEYVWQ